MYSLHIAAQCTFETAKCAFETAKCARSKQRSAHLRLATQVRAQILPHAEGALNCFSETARSKSRSRAPPAALRGRSPRGRRLGKSTPATSPGVGSFLGVKAKPLRGRCASLDPHPLRQCPSKPLRGPLARFSVKGGSRGWCGPQPVGARTRPLDATGATQACRQGVGALFPRHPCPSAKAPAGSPEGAIRHAVQGAPLPGGSRGAQPLGPACSEQKTLCRRRAFLLFELRSSALHGPQKGA